MSISAFSGPLVTFGQSPFPAQEYNPELGTSLLYAGSGILDPRTIFTYIPGQTFGAFTGGFLGETVTGLSVVPYTAATAAVVASANATSATLTLVSASSATTGVSIVSSVINTNTGVADTNGGAGLVMLDGFASFTGSISGTTLTVTANQSAPLVPGMTVSGTGVASGTTVTGYGTATPNSLGASISVTYTVSVSQTVSSATLTAQFASVNSCALPAGQAGSINLWNPQALLGRCVSVTAAASATATTATITGYDIYGYPMTQAVTVTAGSTVNSTKAFKYIKSVVLNAADGTHAYSVGTADIIGLPLRSDTFGDIWVNYGASLTASTLLTAATGYVAAVTTAASSTTGDVRGTYALQAASSTGVNRLTIRQSPQPYNVGSITGLFGVTQA